MSDSAKPGKQPPSARIPFAIAILVVASMAISYYIYVRDQRAYFSSRNLRLLTTLARQLDESLATHHGFVRNYANSTDTAVQYRRASTPAAGKDPGILMPSIDAAERSCVATGAGFPLPLEVLPSGESYERTLFEREGKPWVQFDYAGLEKTGTELPPPNGNPISAPVVDAACPPLKDGTSGYIRRGRGVMLFEDLLDPLFDQSLLGVFDDVMLARADGTVIFASHKHERTVLTTGEEASLPDIIVTNLGSLVEKTGWRKTDKIPLERLRHATSQREISTSAGDFVLFTQPYPFVTPTSKRVGEQWILCGLVSKQRFMYEALSVSMSIVLLVIAAVVVVICGWPYLRIALVGEYQRLTIGDILLLGFCALIQGAIVTLALLDVVAYDRLRFVSDQQLESLAVNLEQSMEKDLSRAVQTLDVFEKWGTGAAAKWTSDLLIYGTEDVPAPEVNYPYLSVLAWIDESGMQRYKATVYGASPLVRVTDRSYFRDAIDDRMLTLDLNGTKRRLAIDSIRSSTRGTPEVVLARRSDASNLPVVAATVQLIHITNAVMPPGFGFAVIEDNGNVVFHSEPERNNQENFFAETDWNRTVRSAVFARQKRTASVRYWGEDHRVYVHPLKELPWTMIVFRDKSLLRTVNTECVAMTLFLLLTNSSMYLVVLVIVLIWNPRYRAPDVWPVPDRYRVYVTLIAVYLVTSAAALLSIYAFVPRSVLQITLLVPAHAITATYLLLNQDRRAPLWRFAAALWGIFTLLWAAAILFGQVMAGTAASSSATVIGILVVGLVLFAGFLTFRPVARPEIDPHRRNYKIAYVAAAFLLLVIGAVLPTIGFFKVANRLEIEGLVKFTQLAIAAKAEKAINAIERASFAKKSAETYKEAWAGDPFDTRWCLVPAAGKPAAAPHIVECDEADSLTALGWHEDREWLPLPFRNVLPAYSEESVSLRQLHGLAEGAPWNWQWRGADVLLDKRITLEMQDAKPLGAARKIYEPVQSEQRLRVMSRVPLSFSGVLLWPKGTDMAGWSIWLTTFLLAIVAVIAFLYWIVRFITRKVLLIDLHEPDWLKGPPLQPTLGEHVFLIHSSTQGVELLFSDRETSKFVPIDFATLAESGEWDKTVLDVEKADAGFNVRIFGFELHVNDARLLFERLKFLERLLALPGRTIIMASTISPPAFLAFVNGDEMRRRWTKVLQEFVWVTESQLEAPVTTGPKGTWLHEETKHTAFLRRLRTELALVKDADDDQLADELLERSDTYYAGLWSSCSNAEKILLHQLALDGLINGKDRKSVRRLLARRLVIRDPNLRIFNETFRRYVVAVAKAEDVPIETQDAPSVWDNIRLPLFVVVVSVVLLIFATQKDLLNLATGMVAALTTGLPAMVKLFGFFTQRRASAAEERV